MINSAEKYIEKLKMEKHPEGGWFTEIFRSDESFEKGSLPERYNGDRHYATSIFYLLREKEHSDLHILNSDELWHFYDGQTLFIHCIDQDGNYQKKKLGLDLDNGAMPSVLVPKLTWFAAEVATDDGFSLVGCTMSPGFEFEDFCLGTRDELLNMFPQHQELIEKFSAD